GHGAVLLPLKVNGPMASRLLVTYPPHLKTPAPPGGCTGYVPLAHTRATELSTETVDNRAGNTGSVVVANLEPEAAGRPGGGDGGIGEERAGVQVVILGEEVVAPEGDPPGRTQGRQLEAGVGEPVGVPVEAG